MIKINQLSSNVYNKISAGEVVERPRSIVKELVENAIDAGANIIRVEIIDGGKTSIKVWDNGVGINKEYTLTAFLPHATSKIATADDLFKISTLGFRGEALASIAAVSQVELTCKAQDDEIGSRVIVHGGEVLSCEDFDREHGCTFLIKNLFYNTPVREKFLKTVKGEEQEITALMADIIVANSNIAIEYYVDGKLIYNSQGKSLFDAVYSIYDTKLISNLLSVDYEGHGIIIKGYISNPEYTKATRSYQTTIVNGRVITNSHISTAVSQGYGQGLMRRAFPVYILDITMPFAMLDVNVHPNKSDVRFADNKLIFSKVYAAIKSTLEKNSRIFTANLQSNSMKSAVMAESLVDRRITKEKGELYNSTMNLTRNTSQIGHKQEVLVDNSQENANSAVSNNADNLLMNKLKNMKVSPKSNIVGTDKVAQSSGIDIDLTIQLASMSMGIKLNNATSMTSNNVVSKNNLEKKAIDDSVVNSHINNAPKNKANEINQNSAAVAQSNIFHQIDNSESVMPEIIGQVFNSYLIVSYLDCVYFLDQHACHERLLYDKLVIALENGCLVKQPLLFSQTIVLSPSDSVYLSQIIPQLASLGIEAEEFGINSLKINSLPIELKNFNLEIFIAEIIDNKSYFNQIKMSDILKDRLAMTACKAAIKAGEKLNHAQIKSLLTMMNDNLPLQCPHGRPAIVKFERKDMDKMFKRIT